MKDILEEIVAHKRIEVAEQKEQVPARKLYAIVEKMMADGVENRSMSKALNEDAYGIIAEFKRKSPSKGWIKEEGKPEVIPPSYEQNGAAALSILTDEKFFGGSMEFIKTVRPLVNIPILRKDFIIDEYQLFQAREIGADAVLLIAADLKKEEAKTLTSLAHELKLEVLLEMHSLEELDYAELDVDMVGINNRNLGSFHTDVQNSFGLYKRGILPPYGKRFLYGRRGYRQKYRCEYAVPRTAHMRQTGYHRPCKAFQQAMEQGHRL